MNRQSLTISVALLALVIVVVAGFVIFGGDEGGDDAVISGPGRAAEARNLIAEIQERRAEQGSNQIQRPAADTIEQGAVADTGSTAPAPAAGAADTAASSGAGSGAAAAGGAVATTPAPTAAAPAGAGADSELDAAYERAVELQAAGELDNAQVLFFFGARQGHARSAFAYAEMNDPNYHSPEKSLLAEPDAFQAFRWYTVARDGGIAEASERLDELHTWAMNAAAAGDFDAEQLLLQWEQ
jgi:hypothetical protein